ncbi:ATP-NAD kinase-like domain-containing protein [Pavlovales sp. CCMP2436]|nr:ATP-NAD kinase-like domain-containing protein [Pavlovales sp. CCMP2436]
MLHYLFAVVVATTLARAALQLRARRTTLRQLRALVLCKDEPGDVSSGQRASVVLIANPIAGSGEGLAIARALRDLAARMGTGMRAELRESVCAGHPRQLAASVANDGFTHVLSVGGDGQLHEVLNGLHDACALEGVRVLHVPAGTGNGIATSLGIHSAAHAARALAGNQSVLLDAWSVTTKPPRQPTLCALSVGWGAVADIDALAEREWRWLGPLRIPLIGAIMVGFHRAVTGAVWFTPARADSGSREGVALECALASGRVRIAEGGPHGCTHVISDYFFLVHACNVASIATNCLMAPRARPADGNLTLCVVRACCGRLGAARVLLSVSAAALRPGAEEEMHGAPDDVGGRLERYACTRLAIVPEASERKSRFAVDGEPLEAATLAASHALGPKGRPLRVRVLVPPA